jgi:hypothetical protein
MPVFDQLNTGNSGVEQTFGNETVQPDKIEAISEQKQQLAELLPGVEHIIDACKAEIEAISDIRAYIKELGPNPPDEAIRAEYRARELYIGYLNRLMDGIADKVAMAEDAAV